jgi:hypothetical protein
MREATGEETGAEPSRNGPGRPAWADRPSPFRARFDAPFDLAASRAIYSPLVESHKDSFVIRRHKTKNKKQIGSQREYSWPSSTSGDSTPWSALQWVTLWGKVLVCPRVEEGAWVVITEPMFWIFCYHIHVHVDGALILLVGRLALGMHRS